MTEIRSFVIREKDGKLFTPWEDVDDLHGDEWIREGGSIIETQGEPRIIQSASYARVDENVPVYLAHDSLKPYRVRNMAVFYDNVDGTREYQVSERLAKLRKVKVGDTVKLEIRGCCSISNIFKLKG